MGIMAFISEKKEQFRQRSLRVAEKNTLSDLEKLDRVRADKEAYQKRSDIGNALRAEKAEVRALKTEKARRVLGFVKESLGNLKGAVNNTKKVYNKGSRASRGAFNSPFGGGPSVGSPSMGSSGGPFSLSASKPEPKKSRDVVIRIQR